MFQQKATHEIIPTRFRKRLYKALNLKLPETNSHNFSDFIESYFSQGLHLSYLLGFALFVGVMVWETVFGQRFGINAWLFIVCWLTPQATIVAALYRKSRNRPANQSVRISILLLNAVMQTVLSVWHTQTGDTTPYFHITVLGQVAFCYAFTSLTLNNAVLSGLGITLGYLAAVLIFTDMSVATLAETAFLFALLNTIGIVSCWRVQENYRLQFQLTQQLQQAADHDPLTKLLNRRGLNERIAKLFNYGNRFGQYTGIAQIDLDKFKAVNDHYGHAAGDQLLKEIAETLGKFSVQPQDIVARLGGDEFMLAWTGKSPADITKRGIKIVEAVEAVGHATRLNVTASVGLRVVAPKHPAPEIVKVLFDADTAAIHAKSEGGNRIMVADKKRSTNNTSTARPALYAVQ